MKGILASTSTFTYTARIELSSERKYFITGPCDQCEADDYHVCNIKTCEIIVSLKYPYFG